MDKVCSRCKETKPRKDFYKCSANKDGLNYYCCSCAKEKNHLNKKKHKERYRIQTREYWNKRRHRWWSIQSLRHHRKKYRIELAVDDLEKLAKTAKNCPLCKRELLWGKKPTGRIVPNSPSLDRVNNEGVITRKNIMILCYSCNTTKGARTLEEFQNYCKLIINNLANQTLYGESRNTIN